jgi:hypothetical protein
MENKWKILSFIGVAGGPTYNINEQGNFDPSHGDSPRNRTLETMLELSRNLFTRGYRVSSIQRLTDNKIFSLGDDITGIGLSERANSAFKKRTVKISSIENVNGIMHFNIGRLPNFSIFEVE